MPYELSPDQMEHRVLACRNNLQIYRKTKELIKRTVSIDETWVSLYMEPDKSQARGWYQADEQPNEISRQNIHANKRMLIMGMDFGGIAFYELLPEKTTVDGNVYKKFLEKHIPHRVGTRNIPSLWLNHDNARPHKHQLVRKWLEDNKIHLWHQPPYSPDISPLDFGCFGILKKRLRGVHHKTWQDFETNLKKVIKELNDSGSMDAIARLPEKWQRVVDSEGHYLTMTNFIKIIQKIQKLFSFKLPPLWLKQPNIYTFSNKFILILDHF